MRLNPTPDALPRHKSSNSSLTILCLRGSKTLRASLMLNSIFHRQLSTR